MLNTPCSLHCHRFLFFRLSLSLSPVPLAARHLVPSPVPLLLFPVSLLGGPSVQALCSLMQAGGLFPPHSPHTLPPTAAFPAPFMPVLTYVASTPLLGSIPAARCSTTALSATAGTGSAAAASPDSATAPCAARTSPNSQRTGSCRVSGLGGAAGRGAGWLVRRGRYDET